MGNICKNLKRFTANINVKDACKSSCCNTVDKHKDIVVINKTIHIDDMITPTPPTSPECLNLSNINIEELILNINE